MAVEKNTNVQHIGTICPVWWFTMGTATMAITRVVLKTKPPTPGRIETTHASQVNETPLLLLLLTVVVLFVEKSNQEYVCFCVCACFFLCASAAVSAEHVQSQEAYMLIYERGEYVN